MNLKEKKDFCALGLYAHSLPSGLARLRKALLEPYPRADPVRQQILAQLKATGLELGWKFKHAPWSEIRCDLVAQWKQTLAALKFFLSPPFLKSLMSQICYYYNNYTARYNSNLLPK